MRFFRPAPPRPAFPVSSIRSGGAGGFGAAIRPNVLLKPRVFVPRLGRLPKKPCNCGR